MSMSAPATGVNTSPQHSTILCVDLDGTLVTTDTLDESIVCLIREHAALMFAMPWWLWKGKAYFKHRVASALSGGVGKLPLNSEVLGVIREHQQRNGEVVLATAANARVAAEVANDLGFFTHCLASSPTENLSGARKLAAIEAYANGREFEYVGDHAKDLPIWKAAKRAFIVDRTGRLAGRMNGSNVVQLGSIPRGDLSAWRRQLRVHQWSKNLLLALPLIAAHQLTNLSAVVLLLLGMFTFSLVASAVYLVNDLLDLQADRNHQRKCRRPLAAGQISIRQAVGATGLLLSIAFALAAWFAPWQFTAMLAGYFGLALLYSLGLKRIAIVDVVMLALFYAYRVLIGGVMVGIICSPWLLAFSLFTFLSLGLLKRYAELELLAKQGDEQPGRRAYTVADAPLLRSFGTGASTVAGLVIVLYLQSDDVAVLYRQPEWLWLVCPLVLAWSMRVWLFASRGQMNEDPVLFALRDKGSYALAIATLCLMLVAS